MNNYQQLLRVDLTIAKAFALTLVATYQGSTAAVYLAGVKGLFDSFLLHELIPSNPFNSPLVTIVNKRKAPLNPTKKMSTEDVTAMLAACDRSHIKGQRDYAILCVLFGGGLRRAEVVNLQNRDVFDDYPMILKLFFTKTSLMEEQSLPDWAAEGLRIHLGNNIIHHGDPTDKLFDLSLEGLHKVWKRICWKSGVKDYGLHSARCTSINRLLDMGYSHAEVRKFSRHSSVAMVERYERRESHPANNPGRSISYEKI